MRQVLVASFLLCIPAIARSQRMPVYTFNTSPKALQMSVNRGAPVPVGAANANTLHPSFFALDFLNLRQGFWGVTNWLTIVPEGAAPRNATIMFPTNGPGPSCRAAMQVYMFFGANSLSFVALHNGSLLKGFIGALTPPVPDQRPAQMPAHIFNTSPTPITVTVNGGRPLTIGGADTNFFNPSFDPASQDVEFRFPQALPGQLGAGTNLVIVAPNNAKQPYSTRIELPPPPAGARSMELYLFQSLLGVSWVALYDGYAASAHVDTPY